MEKWTRKRQLRKKLRKRQKLRQLRNLEEATAEEVKGRVGETCSVVRLYQVLSAWSSK